MNDINIVNLTPHQIVLKWVKIETDPIPYELVIPPSSKSARVESRCIINKLLPNGIPIYEYRFGDVVGLPDPKENTIYIISRLVAEAIAVSGEKRDDIYVVAETIRNSEGVIIGASGLSKILSPFETIQKKQKETWEKNHV